MTFRILIPILLLIGSFVFGFYSVMFLISKFKRSYKNQNIEYNDLTNDSLLKQVNDNLTVIKYCMIFLVVATIFVIVSVLIAYIVHLLS